MIYNSLVLVPCKLCNVETWKYRKKKSIEVLWLCYYFIFMLPTISSWEKKLYFCSKTTYSVTTIECFVITFQTLNVAITHILSFVSRYSRYTYRTHKENHFRSMNWTKYLELVLLFFNKIKYYYFCIIYTRRH